MTGPVTIAAALVVTYIAYRVLYATDIPKIKGLPEIPGLPLFGSLIELGEQHAQVAQRWAKKYGPVFQVRMGNKVCNLEVISTGNDLLLTSA
jgi:phenylacetate 2-hydroxylase